MRQLAISAMVELANPQDGMEKYPPVALFDMCNDVQGLLAADGRFGNFRETLLVRKRPSNFCVLSMISTQNSYT